MLLWLLWATLLCSSLVSAADPQAPPGPTVPPVPRMDLVRVEANGTYKCGNSTISSKLSYCTVFNACDTVGIIEKKSDVVTYHQKEDDMTFAICDKNTKGSTVQIRIRHKPDVWKEVKTINCMDKGGNATIEVKFKKNIAYIEEKKAKNTEEIVMRCISTGRARFDIYHYSENTDDQTIGVYGSTQFYCVYSFISLLGTLTAMAVYYTMYLHFENRKLRKSVSRKQEHHDEFWLSLARSVRPDYDTEETWNAMPLIHQQVAIEAALFLQKYKGTKFTPMLRQWIIDRGYPAASTEIILELAGLADSEYPFFADEEKGEQFEKTHEWSTKLGQYADRIESRIVDTLNYANRLRRRKIVFTDHRWLELHHFFLELLLTSLGSPSHPTIHDADIPVLPRHAFGTRDDPREEEKEEKEAQARLRRPHFLHHDWDEAQRLLGSEA